MSELRISKNLDLPEKLVESTLYLKSSADDPEFLDIIVTSRDDGIPRRTPSKQDIIKIVNDNPPTEIPAEHVVVKLVDGTDSTVKDALATVVGTVDSRVRYFAAKLKQAENATGWELTPDSDDDLNVIGVTKGQDGRLSLTLRDSVKRIRSAVAQFHTDSESSTVIVTAVPTEGNVILKATSNIGGRLTYQQDGTFSLDTPVYLQGTVTVEKAVEQLDSITINHSVPTDGDVTITRMMDGSASRYFGEVAVNKVSDTSVNLSTIDDLIFRIDYIEGKFVTTAPSELGITCAWDAATGILDVNIPDTPGYLGNNLDFTYDGDEIYRTEIQDKSRTKLSFAWIDTGYTRIMEPGPMTKITVFLKRRDKTSVLNPFDVRFDCGRGEVPFDSLYIPGAVIEVSGVYEVTEAA